jgi:hypothetical protein
MKNPVLIVLCLCGALVFSMLTAFEIPVGDIIFSHKTHVGDRSFGCFFCHDTIEQSMASSDKNLPLMEKCMVCHNGQTAPADCALCHRDAADPKALANPRREIIFSHQNHLARDLVCEKCHPGVASAQVMTQANFPGMFLCMECHDAKKAPSECSVCHSEAERVKRVYHGEGWSHRHKFQGTLEPDRCRLCHVTDTTCEECHLGDNLQRTSHPLNYVYEHPLDVRGKERECAACHDEESFCSPCHVANQVMPANHSSASWPREGHAQAVRSDLEVCLACHETNQMPCLRCHMDRDGVRGTDPPIHERDLGRDDHGPWHNDPGIECYDCHDPASMSAGEFFCGYCHGAFGGGGGRVAQ